jgi:hypothetical protein
MVGSVAGILGYLTKLLMLVLLNPIEPLSYRIRHSFGFT